MMIRYLAITMLALAVFPVAADAQRRAPYTPNRSPISPYFDLFRSDTGGIPNYHAFLRRDQEFRRFVQSQYTQDRRRDTRLGSLERSLSTRQSVGGGIRSNRLQLRPTLIRPVQPSTFMNYQHYYGTPQSQRRR